MDQKNQGVFQKVIYSNWISAYLFLFFFIIYNLNLSIIENGDAIPASLLPFSILENHNLYLDQFSNYFAEFTIPWMINEVNGHLLSAYPIVTPILVTPIYIIPYIILKYLGYPIDMLNPGFQLIVEILEKISSSIIAALAGFFIYLTIEKLTSKLSALVTAIFFAIGTNTWATSSQQLWQHGVSELSIAILLYIIFIDSQSRRDLAVMGIVSGLFIFNRPSDAFLLLPILYYSLKSNNSIYYLIGCLSGLPFLIYNLYYFDNIFGGYSSLINGITTNNNAIGLLISPSRGLLVYSPIVILAFFGFLKSRKNIFYVLMAMAIFAELLFYGSFSGWHSGGSYGPRFMTAVLPYIAVFTGLYLNKIDFRKDPIVVSLIFILFIWSIFVQIVGVAYPYWLWPNEPTGIYNDPARLWNWSDMEIFRDFKAGPMQVNPLNSLKMIIYQIHR